jgi:hypothetical protein
MRQGVNPEKFKAEKNTKKKHRVVVVFYIPNTEEDYYLETLKVLDISLDSLLKTINPQTTNITLINNNSTKESEAIVAKYQSQIDKYVLYSENKGKVYAVVNEIRSVFEPFVTIADSDVLFFSGWETAVFDVFKNHPKAGVVAPLPSQYSTFYCTASVFFAKFFTAKLRYGKVVADADVDLYIKGVNNEALMRSSSKYNWKEKQYYLDGKVKAVIGATHFVATYKSAIFKDQDTFPKIKFKNGYEEKFIDFVADIKGLYRLSTVKTYAYHIGNKIDEVVAEYKAGDSALINPAIFDAIPLKKNYANSFIPFPIKRIFLKVFKNSKDVSAKKKP